MNPPTWFVLELHTFDPALRLRWSPKRQLYQIERKIQNSLPIDASKKDCYDDDYVRARDGYILVASVPPHGLTRGVLQKLRDSDLWSRGGWARVIREIEEREAADEERKWAAFSDDIKGYSADLYSYLKVRDGRTVYNAGHPE